MCTDTDRHRDMACMGRSDLLRRVCSEAEGEDTGYRMLFKYLGDIFSGACINKSTDVPDQRRKEK